MDEIDGGIEHSAPAFAVFGDLMAGLLGAFVLILVGVLGVQLELAAELETEVQKRQLAENLRQAEEQRRMTLEQALAAPLATGRVTLRDGRIGISGSVLFDLNSTELEPGGRALLKSLAAPLAAYLAVHDEMLMVSGFTDDLPVHETNRRFADNWELSAERALTVTRALIEEGVPSSSVFAAAFGAEQPVAANTDAEGRSQNRRVEMAPVPKSAQTAAQAEPSTAAHAELGHL